MQENSDGMPRKGNILLARLASISHTHTSSTKKECDEAAKLLIVVPNVVVLMLAEAAISPLPRRFTGVTCRTANEADGCLVVIQGEIHVSGHDTFCRRIFHRGRAPLDIPRGQHPIPPTCPFDHDSLGL